ncbi:hypothetical protein Q4574_09660 [Aliiglaciecola sp. 3_MG-2023]|uniref:hypothetical protein n=1 Tax=Aliiglaciecola sp. 3_MG-2023 TaxID=3062644 RepID=UPI0026E1B154|nr:hypothetical protein [Aliiglaciecola sp. 3_MG-2023]MDO6693550.1 hypothetical protein [Aliiglaciecola sp. 3_MG-2023]
MNKLVLLSSIATLSFALSGCFSDSQDTDGDGKISASEAFPAYAEMLRTDGVGNFHDFVAPSTADFLKSHIADETNTSDGFSEDSIFAFKMLLGSEELFCSNYTILEETIYNNVARIKVELKQKVMEDQEWADYCSIRVGPVQRHTFHLQYDSETKKWVIPTQG